MSYDNESFRIHSKKDAKPIEPNDGDVGYDIPLPSDEVPFALPPNTKRVVDTGIIADPPDDHFLMIVPRSSMYKKGVRLSNTAAVIDPSFSGQEDTIVLSLERGPVAYEYVGTLDNEGPLKSGVSSSFLQKAKGYIKRELDVKAPRLEDVNTHQESEEKVQVFYRDTSPAVFEAGDRLVQMIVLPYKVMETKEKAERFFSSDSRSGLGSTGR